MRLSSISRDSTVVAGTDQISSQLEGETVMLALSDGVYYGLDSVGARVWELVQTPRAVGEVCSRIEAEYDVEAGRCERDVLRLLGELVAAGMLEVRGASSS